MSPDTEGALASVLPSLRWLARGLLNQDLVIQPLAQAGQHGLPPRPVLTTTHVLLPELGGYTRHRAAVAHAVAHLKYSTPASPAAGLKPMTVALASAIEDARVERLLLREFPGMHGWFLAPLRLAAQPRGLDFAALVSRMDLALTDPNHQDDHPWVNKARALFEAQAADLGDAAGFQRVAFILAHDLGQMRVPFRPRQYQVAAPYRDDNTFLWMHAGSEVDPPPAMELDVPPPPGGQEPPTGQGRPRSISAEEAALHLYPEWDHRLALARQHWCTVVDRLPPWRPCPDDPMTSAANTSRLTLTPARRRHGVGRLRRQPEGDDLDLDAVVESMVSRRTRSSAESRVHTRRGARDTAASILLLLDLSASTQDRLDDADQSFLEVEKSAALMLAQAVHARGDRIAVHGFSSNTRAEVSYYRLLAFGAPLDASAHALLSQAPARHSTRMGAALRHATACLANEPNELKAILVLTDGAPSDIDVHEPRYLVEDARHAVQAARAAGVQVHGLAVGRQADACARRIFGWRHHHILDKPVTLSTKLCGLYRWLAAA